MELIKPRRDVNYLPINYQGKTYILVQDRLGLVKENILLPAPLYNFIVHMDRASSLEELQVKLIRENRGVIISKDEIINIIEQLDRLYLLESENYNKKKRQIIEEFSSLKVRPFCFAGKSYPLTSELISFLESILGETADLILEGEIKAIFAPHIDIAVGKEVYGKAYGVLKGRKFDRVVILGVGHGLSEGIFCVSDKDFDTPLGVVENDKEASNRLKNIKKNIVSPTDFEHKFEHSIEFQLIFLKYILKDFKIIPILCGSLLYLLPEHTRKTFLNACDCFLQELRAIITNPSYNTLVVAGVDFSHIGPKFGHQESVYGLKKQASNHDKTLLDCLIKRDRDGFWKESISVMDRYNVCGFSALATLMEVVEYHNGIVMDYKISVEEPTSSGVGFAGGVLY
jgi:AmmeMemoRadiSam system protein B